MMNNFKKYERYKPFILNERSWPSKIITEAPIWSSVDLRDGNQALKVPMNIEKKLKLFHHLVKIGIKQIEVGFPFATDTDFNFVRTLIEDKHIPDDVTIIVLSSSSPECIERSFEALKGADKAVIQIYTLVSPAQRKYVINMSKTQLLKYTADAAAYTLECSKKYPNTDFTLGYGPESFTITEVDFSLAVCNSVVRVWKPTPENKCMVTLPATVEASMVNQFADQVEYIHNNLITRENVILGLHTHNDRGTCTAATELGILAGAERVEGTLFGNGERTGNLDLVTIALNMYSSGIDPKLDFSNLDESVRVYEQCTGCKVHDRHPYAGKQVFTAYSGGHQDAIRKGLLYREANNEEKWMIPYIPVDPVDLGRSMDGIIQINSQSGKGGVQYILEKALGITLPMPVQKEFGKKIKVLSDKTSQCLSGEEVISIFLNEYTLSKHSNSEYSVDINQLDERISVNISWQGRDIEITGYRDYIIDTCFKVLKEELSLDDVKITQHTDIKDDKGRFYTFIQLQHGEDEVQHFSFGWGTNKLTTQILALCKSLEKTPVMSLT